jgi:hypothetical protein
MTDDEMRALLGEEDDFRVAIRGFTAIERMIDEAIEDALPGRWDGKARTFGPFARRVELAVALALVAPPWTKALRELASVRNDLAHGNIEHVTRARARRLAKAVEPMVADFPQVFAGWEKASPSSVLRDVILVVHFAVRTLVEQNQEWRYEQHQTRRFQRVPDRAPRFELGTSCHPVQSEARGTPPPLAGPAPLSGVRSGVWRRSRRLPPPLSRTNLARRRQRPRRANQCGGTALAS